jgi:hypothetical protein
MKQFYEQSQSSNGDKKYRIGKQQRKRWLKANFAPLSQSPQEERREASKSHKGSTINLKQVCV